MKFWDDLKYRLVMAAFNPAMYDTKLHPQDEQKFNSWRQTLPGNLNNDHDYDLRGAWKSGAGADANLHMPDTFKKPNHITFSTQSKYSTHEMPNGGATPGGQWTKLGPHPTKPNEHTWSFKPSQFNLNMHGPEKMQNYFKQAEEPNGNSLQL